MTDDKMTDPLVDGVKIAVVHFGKATLEVVTGIGALFVGITQTVRPADDGEDDDSGAQTIEVE
jgi:hypothetical protein